MIIKHTHLVQWQDVHTRVEGQDPEKIQESNIHLHEIYKIIWIWKDVLPHSVRPSSIAHFDMEGYFV